MGAGFLEAGIASTKELGGGESVGPWALSDAEDASKMMAIAAGFDRSNLIDCLPGMDSSEILLTAQNITSTGKYGKRLS